MDNGYFRYDIRPEGAYILGYVDSIDKATKHNPKLIIPDEINGNKVTGIGLLAFRGQSIGEVVIGKYISRIMNKAFVGCGVKKLTFLTDTSDADAQLKIGRGAFANNDLSSVDFPDVEMLSIRTSSFKNNKLTSVVFPKHTYRIGRGAFYGNNIKSVEFLGDGLFMIEDMAFAENFYLKSVMIPPSTQVVDSVAFDSGCIVVVNESVAIDGLGFTDDDSVFVIVPDVTKIDGSRISDLKSDANFSKLINRIDMVSSIYKVEDTGGMSNILSKYVVETYSKG